MGGPDSDEDTSELVTPRVLQLEDSEILASKSGCESPRFDTVLEDSTVEEFDEFAAGLCNISCQAISENSIGAPKMDESSKTKKEEPSKPTVSLFVVLLIPVILGIVVSCWISLQANSDPAQSSSVKYKKDQKEGNAPVTKPKESKLVWREEFEKKGSTYRLLSDDDIKYTKGGPMFLVVAGHVFDVSDGGSMYAEDSGYHGFIGKDGSRAYVTGKFDKEGLISDLEGLTPEDNKGISGWIDFYLNHEKYKFVGILKGWFFDDSGKPTENMKEFMKNVDLAEMNERSKMKVEEQFPTCNIEWSADTGSRLWCSSGSGGTQRSWVGVPRQFFEEKDSIRCACVDQQDLDDPRVKEYKGCEKTSYECRLKE